MTITCDIDCYPICDFCIYFRFNGNEIGAYLNEGECAHPAHPHPEDPSGGCGDFHCTSAEGAPADQLALHNAAQKTPRKGRNG